MNSATCSPTMLITDSVAPWGQWVGQILGVPVVTSTSTVAFNRQVLAFAARQGVQPKSARLIVGKLRAVSKAIMLARRLRARYGVPGTGMIGTVAGHSDLNIVYTSRYFQPCGDTFDARYEFVGPSIGTRMDSGEFPWESIGNGGILLYVSMGTLFNADASFYRSCFDAFRDLDLQVILALGGNVSIADLGRVPGNFIVRDRVPQIEVLSRASAFVTHGGMNSVSESLSFGVPMVVIPQMSEQAIVARRVEALGAGVYLAKEDVTADRLAESVLHVLGDPRFGDRAAWFRCHSPNAGVLLARQMRSSRSREGRLRGCGPFWLHVM